MVNAPLKPVRTLFCDLCGRVCFEHQESYKWWLDGKKYGTKVIRCPQHITEWSLRTSGKGRTKESFKHMRQAKENDCYDVSKEWLQPVFLLEDI